MNLEKEMAIAAKDQLGSGYTEEYYDQYAAPFVHIAKDEIQRAYQRGLEDFKKEYPCVFDNPPPVDGGFLPSPSFSIGQHVMWKRISGAANVQTVTSLRWATEESYWLYFLDHQPYAFLAKNLVGYAVWAGKVNLSGL